MNFLLLYCALVGGLAATLSYSILWIDVVISGGQGIILSFGLPWWWVERIVEPILLLGVAILQIMALWMVLRVQRGEA